MDIVERLQEFVGQYLGNANLDDELTEAANEIARLREDMVEIMYLLTRGPNGAQDIMDIVKPWAIQQIAYINARAALKEKLQNDQRYEIKFFNSMIPTKEGE